VKKGAELKMEIDILKEAKNVFDIEIAELEKLKSKLGDDFQKLVRMILELKNNNKVVVTGIGKSGIIGKKITATLASTGTTAVFINAAEALHGDLGMISDGDVVIAISNSGNSDEVLSILAPIRKIGGKIVAFTGNPDSMLGKYAELVINVGVEKEACPLGQAPMSSTTATLVTGDALAVCLMKLKDFTENDFAKYHPGGALGKRLYLTVGETIAKNQVPIVAPETDIKQVIIEISQKMLGVTAVLDGERIVGVITDGDIRRMLSRYEEIKGLKARDIMSTSPKTIDAGVLAVDALDFMQNHKITQLLVTRQGQYVGVIHLHNLIQEGII